MMCSPATSLCCALFVTILAVLPIQVTTSESNSCYPEECLFNEYCCDGVCCTYFQKSWYPWTFFAVTFIVVIMACFCSNSLWARNHEPEVAIYYILSDDNRLYTKAYQQQPYVPIHMHGQAFEPVQPPQYHPYRCEQLTQQSYVQTMGPPFGASAPPKSP